MAYYKTNINTIKTRLSKRSKQAQKNAVSREFRVQTAEEEQKLGGLERF